MTDQSTVIGIIQGAGKLHNRSPGSTSYGTAGKTVGREVWREKGPERTILPVYRQKYEIWRELWRTMEGDASTNGACRLYS